jgi:hypothetical protein
MMKAKHFKLLGLVLGVQLILLSALILFTYHPETSFWHVIGMMCSVGTFLVAYGGYIFALYSAPFISRAPPIVKMLALGFISLALTGAGYLFAIFLFTCVGIPLSHN